MVRNIPPKGGLDTDCFSVIFYHLFKEEIPIIHKHFQLIREHFPTYSMRPVLPWYKPDKDITTKGGYD